MAALLGARRAEKGAHDRSRSDLVTRDLMTPACMGSPRLPSQSTGHPVNPRRHPKKPPFLAL